MTAQPLFWLKKIETALIDIQEIPLWGFPPEFPWEKAGDQVRDRLQLQSLKIEHYKTEVLRPEAFLSGFGKAPIDILISLTPLPGEIHWIMGQEGIAQITDEMLNGGLDKKGISSPSFQEGFYRYLSLQVVQAIDQLKAFDDLSLKLAPDAHLPTEEALCIDVALSLNNTKLFGRLVCPFNMVMSFKNHFSSKRPSLTSFPLSQEIDIDLSLDLGSTSLKLSDWDKIALGDCLILDRGSYDPSTHKGTVTLVLEGAPLFRARLKENHLKIVDYAFYYEEEHIMDTYPPDEEKNDLPPEDVFEDSSLEIDENDPQHLWSAPDTSQETPEQLISTREVPITITVEVARLKMNLEKLLALKPGNLIELPVRPEQGVDLVINGKKVAKGELVKLGDVLGVKILAL